MIETDVAKSSLNEDKAHLTSPQPAWRWSDPLWTNSGDGPSLVWLDTFKLVLEMQINLAWFESTQPRVAIQEPFKTSW